MIKIVFSCINPDCERTGRIEADCENENEICNCPDCKEPMKVLGHKTYGGGSGFSSKPKTEQRAILQKRSNDHFNKEIKEKKIQMGRQFAAEGRAHLQNLAAYRRRKKK